MKDTTSDASVFDLPDDPHEELRANRLHRQAQILETMRIARPFLTPEEFTKLGTLTQYLASLDTSEDTIKKGEVYFEKTIQKAQQRKLDQEVQSMLATAAEAGQQQQLLQQQQFQQQQQQQLLQQQQLVAQQAQLAQQQQTQHMRELSAFQFTPQNSAGESFGQHQDDDDDYDEKPLKHREGSSSLKVNQTRKIRQQVQQQQAGQYAAAISASNAVAVKSSQATGTAIAPRIPQPMITPEGPPVPRVRPGIAGCKDSAMMTSEHRRATRGRGRNQTAPEHSQEALELVPAICKLIGPTAQKMGITIPALINNLFNVKESQGNAWNLFQQFYKLRAGMHIFLLRDQEH